MDPKLFDHTILNPNATLEAVTQICTEALKYGFMSVCVNGFYTAFVKEKLKDSSVKACSVIGFPLGQMNTAAKYEETKLAVIDGADEIDMVINVGALKDKNYHFVREEIKSVKEACGNALLKVIIETCLLTDEEKRIACRLVLEAGADFVKTSTGFSSGGATADDIALMHEEIGGRLGIKASGGIRTKKDAEKMVKAGATRLGTSRTVEIVS
ncbi:MAG: deoxyribose-phosphate aldolase [Lachnospiraceae bacterium]|nr:deoxyribose-phosphate aldolase [Lachnospiraceae bacterium]